MNVPLASAARKSAVAELAAAKAAAAASGNAVPAGFYDDPLADAAAQRIDPAVVLAAARQREWEEFEAFADAVIAEDSVAAAAEEAHYADTRATAARLENAAYAARLDVLRHLRALKAEHPEVHILPPAGGAASTSNAAAADSDDDGASGEAGAELVSGLSFLTAGNAAASGITAREIATLLTAGGGGAAAGAKRARARDDAGDEAATGEAAAAPPAGKRAAHGAGSEGGSDSDDDSSGGGWEELLDWRHKGRGRTD